MLTNLGASLDLQDMKPNFLHPADDSLQVHIFLDICHMLKLVHKLTCLTLKLQ